MRTFRNSAAWVLLVSVPFRGNWEAEFDVLALFTWEQFIRASCSIPAGVLQFGEHRITLYLAKQIRS